ncbi:MAG: hypothetical protein JW986_01610 [Methanotrichaceae archaeon]|nr:hypothetical protein [Methanotrichaceae archaeon]
MRVSLWIIVLFASLLSGAWAHVPLILPSSANISEAVIIHDPSKSWAIYGDLEMGDVQYYSFKISKGERIKLSLLAADAGYLPGMVLMGPGLEGDGILPPGMDLPDGYGAVVARGSMPKSATYEPFGPGSYYGLADLDLAAPENGTYYVAIYGGAAGNYGLVIGYRETFSLDELVSLPLNMISVHRWEGQSLALILLPFLAVLTAGYYLLLRRDLSLSRWLASLAGLLFLGSSASILFQMAMALMRAPAGGEVAITIVLAALSAGLGAGTIKIAAGVAEFTMKERLMLRAIGLVAILVGSGMIIGPLIAILSTATGAGGRNNTTTSNGKKKSPVAGKGERKDLPRAKGKRKR